MKLTNRRIKWAINQVVKHKKRTKIVARIYGVSQRRTQQLVRIYRDMGDNKIHIYLKEKGYAHPDPKKQKKRKRCRYERKHSLSLVHAGWFAYNGKKITAQNTNKILKKAETVAINTDRGFQYNTD